MILGVTAALVLGACATTTSSPGATTSGSKGATPLTKVEIMYPAIAPSAWPLWVAKEIGAFEKYGIDAKLTFVEGGNKSAAGLISGQIQFGLVAGSNVLESNAAGADIVGLMSLAQRLTDTIVGGKGVSTANDLKGGAVASNEPGGEADYATRYAMEQLGLKPDVDVQVRQVGGETTRVAALVSGSVKAAFMDISLVPDMEKQGFKVLYNFLDGNLAFAKTAFATTRAYLTKNPSIVEAAVKAMLEGVAYEKNHKEETLKIAGKYSDTQNVQAFAYQYDVYAKALPYVPKVVADGYKTIQGWAKDAKVKALDPTKQYDNSILEKLEKEGFTKSVESR
jgi:NitT/TauT family transport system substrate-binding protein